IAAARRSALSAHHDWMVQRVSCHVVRGSMKMPRIRRWRNGDVFSSRSTRMSSATVPLLSLNFFLYFLLFLRFLGRIHLVEIHGALDAGLESLDERVAKQPADHGERARARVTDGALEWNGCRHLVLLVIGEELPDPSHDRFPQRLERLLLGFLEAENLHVLEDRLYVTADVSVRSGQLGVRFEASLLEVEAAVLAHQAVELDQLQVTHRRVQVEGGFLRVGIGLDVHFDRCVPHGQALALDDSVESVGAVSYTHLTLPTSDLV